MEDRLQILRDKTLKLTTSPGVYLMKDKSQNIIYIGKAKNLKNRVTSYFRKSADHTPKVAKMVSNVYDYDFIVTDSEYEALLLECSLIKQNSPKYNILLKDDKGYFYIKITDEEYPRIVTEMQKKNDGTYLGPYTSGFVTKQAVTEANKMFMLPTCKRRFPQEFKKQRPCLNYDIKQCMGVCLGEFSKENYQEIVKQAVDYIKEGSVVSIEKLTEEMLNASENLEFERAAKLRDRINAISKAADSQKIFSEDMVDTDVIGFAENVSEATVSILMYRNGKLYDKNDYYLGEMEDSNSLREEFLTQYYSVKTDIPKNVLIDEDIENNDLIEKLMREKSGHAVYLSSPKKGAQLRLIMLAKNNASEYLSIKIGRTGKEILALEELGKLLGMSEIPRYIEAYDISNLASSSMVAGMVVFENGRPLKKAYRKFSIKTVDMQNDYACMREVLERRFKHYYEDEQNGEGFARLPDLILVDGGKGHVGAVEPLLREMGITVPVYGMVKDNKHRTRAIASSGSEISVSSTKSAFMLITKIQDEVHRYSISYQRSKHSKNTYELELTKIKGIGLKKAQKLITHFKTKTEMKKASAEELSRVAGINSELATELYNVIQTQL